MEEQKTAGLVREEIEKEFFLLEPLFEGLINTTALARKFFHVIKKKNRKATVESISIAITRYVQSAKSIKVSDNIKEVLGSSQLSTKDNIIHITLPRSGNIVRSINDISSKIKWDSDEICLLNQGAGEITIIIDGQNLNLFSSLQKEMVLLKDGLAILTVKESHQNSRIKGIDSPGLYAYLIGQLSRKGINIIEIISTSSEISFILDEKDLILSYQIMKACIENCKRVMP